MQLNKLSGHIVIQHSEVNYNSPVDGEITAVCEFDDEIVLKRFMNTINRKGRGHIKLTVNIIFEEKTAVQFWALCSVPVNY